MPAIIPSKLDCFDTLSKEGAFVISKEKFNGEAKRIAIVNLMPTKKRTETQLIRLISHAKENIEVTLVYTSTYTPTHVDKAYLDAFYKRFYDIKDEKFDGVIITGAPVENMAFEDVAYWGEFKKMIDFASKNANNALYICWGAQAALYAKYGVQKYPLDSKLFGIFKAQKLAQGEPLLDGLDDIFLIPNSRHTTINDECVAKNTVVLAKTHEGGIAIARDYDSKAFYLTGHSEYDKFTLYDEYMRDVNKGLKIDKPINYFVGDSLDEIDYSWHSDAIKIFTNWINNYVAN